MLEEDRQVRLHDRPQLDASIHSYARIPSANRSARSSSPSFPSDSRPIGATSRTVFRLVARLSQLTTDSDGNPSRFPTRTSEAMSRIVRVTNATVTRDNTGIAPLLERTTTGLRPAEESTSAQ